MSANLAAALGTTIGSLFLLACIVILHSRVSRQQKELERLSRDVADLNLAEDRRSLAELKYPNTNILRRAPGESRRVLTAYSNRTVAPAARTKPED
jgi:hypothetical protein